MVPPKAVWPHAKKVLGSALSAHSVEIKVHSAMGLRALLEPSCCTDLVMATLGLEPGRGQVP